MFGGLGPGGGGNYQPVDQTQPLAGGGSSPSAPGGFMGPGAGSAAPGGFMGPGAGGGAPGGYGGYGGFSAGPPGGGYPDNAGGFAQGPPGAAGNYGAYGGDPQGAYPVGPGQTTVKKGAATLPNWLLFAAACCLMFCSLISFIGLMFAMSVADSLNFVYTFVFGTLLALLEKPFFPNIAGFRDMKAWIQKYCGLLTRIAGKGIVYVFLGCSLMSTMCSNLGDSSFIVFIAVVCNSYVILVGLGVIVISYFKSNKLAKVQAQLRNGTLEQRFPQYAHTYPYPQMGAQSGLTMFEFNVLTKDVCSADWEEPDLQLIFLALCQHPYWRPQPGRAQAQAQNPRGSDSDLKVTMADLQAWVQGGWVWL
eukprot:TRINITY_DN92406_c0_g1_i1.p1 TRINITY_DN92406_c0_g1~~TRINITY_DN92406_c0_g1_i1.p1  ORF type:complete len:363 (+),score=44.25 TRINITY_DN92406_c0_g1_i1:119-1207(+)